MILGAILAALAFPAHAGETTDLITESRTAKSGIVVAVSRPRSMEPDPYVVKFTSRTYVAAYQGTKELYKRKLAGNIRLVQVSDSAEYAVLTNAGYDPEELPPMKLRGEPRDALLTAQRILVLDSKGQIAYVRSFDAGTPPDNVAFSPNSIWLTDAVGSARTYLVNMRTGQHEEFESSIVGWDVDNSGYLSTWRNEGKAGEWAELNGQKVWKQAPAVLQRKFGRALGASKIQKLPETRVWDAKTGETHAP